MGELQLREREVGLRLAERGDRALDLGLLHDDLPPLALHPPERGARLVDALPGLVHREDTAGQRRLGLLRFLLGLVQALLGGLEGGGRGGRGHLGLIEVALGDEAALEQPAHPLFLPRGLALGGLPAGDLRAHGRGGRVLGLQRGPRLDHRRLGRLLRDPSGLERGARLLDLGRGGLAGQLGLGAGGLLAGRRDRHRGPGLVTLGRVVAGIDPEQEVARLDRAVVVDVDRRHVARDLGADDDDVSLDVGVVGGDVLAALPPHVAAVGQRDQRDRCGQADQTPSSHGPGMLPPVPDEAPAT